MKTYKIFLASSNELSNDRREFSDQINFLNNENERLGRNVRFVQAKWECADESVAALRKQDDYNDLLATCDLFVMLYWTKVGKYSEEEFDQAYQRLKGTRRLFVYKKTALPIHPPSEPDTQSLHAFEQKLLAYPEHFVGDYETPGDLKHKIQTELTRLFNDGVLLSGENLKAECLYDAGKAAVPTTFVGRTDELQEIRRRLIDGGRLMLINSEGGMGKTTLAARYWDENLHQYQYNAWLFCEKGIVEEIKSLAPSLGIDLSKFPTEKQQIDEIRTALNNKTREGQCLLVLDNANNPDQIRAFQQEFGGIDWHILMTSRCSSVLDNEFPIRHLPPDVAKALFMKLYTYESGPTFDQLLDQFVNAVGYNTLAIEIFAKNLDKAARYHRETLADFLKRLPDTGLLLGKKSFKVKTGYLQAVHKSKPNEDATTDQIIEALYDLTQLSESERYWLVNLSLLPAVSHEAYLLGQLFDQDVAELCENHLEPLAQKGWLSTDTQTYRLSPVVQNIVLTRNKATLEKDSAELINRLNHLLETDGFFTKNVALTEALPFADIGRVVVDSLPVNTWERSLLYFNLGTCFQELGLLTQSLMCIEKYAELSEDRNDLENLAISYSKLGTIYQAQGKLEQALNYFEKYNNLTEELYQSNPRSESLKNGLAISYSKLGTIYQAQGKLEQALNYFEKRSKLGEELYQSNPRSESLKNGLAISYSKLGTIYQAQGKLEQALNYFEKETDLFEELYQSNPRSESLKNGLAISYEKLGEIYQAQGKLEQALNYFEKDLNLTEELYQSNPRSESLKNGLAISYEKLGEIYQAQGKLEQALNYFEKDLNLTEELYQSNPRSESLKNGLAISYSKLGTIYQVQGKLEQALNYFEKDLNLTEELYQSNPRSESLKNGLAISYSKLGTIYQAQGKLEQALNYFEKDLNLTEELYQSNPRSESLKNGLAISYSKLGTIYQVQGKLEQALNYFEKDLNLTEELYQSNPRSESLKNGLAISYSKLGTIYQAQGKLEQALNYFEKYNNLTEELYQSNPRSVALIYGLATSYLWIGYTYEKLTEKNQALRQYQKALPLLESLLVLTPIPLYQEQLDWVKRAIERMRTD